jgi:hypothetical protein
LSHYTSPRGLHFFQTGSYYVAQSDFKIKIILLQPLECWDYRCSQPRLGFEPYFKLRLLGRLVFK